MKIKNIAFILMATLLASCEFTIGFVTSSNPSSNTSSSGSTFISESSSDGETSSSFSSESSSKPLEKPTIQVNPVDFNTRENESSVVLDSTFFSNMGSFSTGNYVDNDKYTPFTKSGIAFEYYRALYDGNGLATLLPYYSHEGDKTIPGAIYNVDKIEKLHRVIVEYYNIDDTSTGFTFSVSGDNHNYVSLEAPSSYERTLIEFDLTNASYFKIETIRSRISIVNITLFYEGEILPADRYSSGENETRCKTRPFEGELIDGISSVDVIINDEVKTFTYYSTEYVYQNPEYADVASLTKPEDVATYVSIFKEAPANYIIKNQDTSTHFSVFGKNKRYYSTWSRTDGYVKSMPVNLNNLSYIEFDIALGDTYIKDDGYITRGVARVVTFMTGFTLDAYKDDIVSVYTDDHYSTFQEYLNDGTFGNRFSVSSYRTEYIYGEPTTLSYNL